MNTSKIAHQAKLSAWANSFREQQASGLSVQEWCLQHNVSKNSFFYWKRKLKDEYLEAKLPEIVKLSLPADPKGCTTITTACASDTTELPGTDEKTDSNSDSDSCTSSTTVSKPYLPAVPVPAHPKETLLLHIEDVSLEISEDTPDALILKIIKAVRNA
jgi:transposase-like protein